LHDPIDAGCGGLCEQVVDGEVSAGPNPVVDVRIDDHAAPHSP
jgi:hypothetical protein